MGSTQLRYCACGATRQVSTELRIASCVRCGRALMSTPGVAAPPSSTVAVVAALASQLLGALAFFLVLASAWVFKIDGWVALGAPLALGALWVFAGGSAVRGSLAALTCCALLDTVLAAICFANAWGASGFVRAATARAAPALTMHIDTIQPIVGGIAALAAVACVAAIPQVRRMAAWRDARIAQHA